MILIDKRTTNPRFELAVTNLIEESKKEFDYYYPSEDTEYDGGNDLFAYDNEDVSALHEYFDCEPVATRIAQPAIVYWMFIPSGSQDCFKVGKAKDLKNLKLRMQECKRWNANSRIAGYLIGTDKTERVLHTILKEEGCHVKNELFSFCPFSFWLYFLSCEKRFIEKVDWMA